MNYYPHAQLEVAIELDSPVALSDSFNAKEHTAKYVVWRCTASEGHVHVSGTAFGNYFAIVSFSLTDAPEWAPPCPPSLRESALTLLREATK